MSSLLPSEKEILVERERPRSPIVEIIQPTLPKEEMVSSPRFAVEIPFSGNKATMDSERIPYEVLDLALDGIESSEFCRRTMKILSNAKRVIVVAGAGISVAAGIPDFRSPTGLFATLRADTKYKPSGKALFDASVYKSEAGTQSYNEMMQSLHSLTSKANPTSFHSFLDKISPRLLRLYTQNIDSLENRFESLSTTVPLPQKAPWPKTIQLHGDLNFATCSKCHWVGSLDPTQLSTGEIGCEECKVADDVRQVVGKRCQGVGMIRPRVVLYHETNPDADAIGAVSNADIRARPSADLVVVVGTSLKIPGTKRIVRESIKAVHHTPKGKAIWINLDPPPTKDFDIWIKGDCQRIPTLYDQFEERLVREKEEKAEHRRRKEEEKLRAGEERLEKRARERIRKEENQRLRELRKEEKQLQKAERLRKQEARKEAKEMKLAEKERRQLERAMRPTKKAKKVKSEEMWSRPLTPFSYNTDSTLSSPSLSDVEFASFVESDNKSTVVNTPTMSRIIEYLPTPAPTPQKGQSEPQEQDSPLKNKNKRKYVYMDEPGEMENSTSKHNCMSLQFLMDQE